MQFVVFAVLVLAPAVYCATTANICRIAGTAVGSALGGINGGTLEAGCADTSNACKTSNKPNPAQPTVMPRPVGVGIATGILGNVGGIFGGIPGAGQVVQSALNLACSQVATADKIAAAVKAKDANGISKEIAKVVCTPVNYAATVTTCNEAVKAAKVAKGTDLSKVAGCQNLQFIDTLGKPCIPQAA